MVDKDINERVRVRSEQTVLPRGDAPGEQWLISMSDPLIKSVNRPPRVRDALNKPDPEKKRKPRQRRKDQRKKDSNRIIDTYA